jgi:hypothetical protein
MTSNSDPLVVAHPEVESATLVVLPTLITVPVTAPATVQTSSEAGTLPRPSSPQTNHPPNSPIVGPETVPSISLVAATSVFTTVISSDDEVRAITSTLNYYSTLTLAPTLGTNNGVSISPSSSSLVHPPVV